MKQLKDKAELSPLISAQFQRGVMTNAPFSPDAYAAELERGSLWAQELEGGLLLLRRREGFDRLYFYLQPGADLGGWQGAQTTVVEIPAKPGADTGALDEVWRKGGFRPVLKRQRMQRREKPSASAAMPVQPAQEGQLAEIMALLQRHYDRRTACLPTAGELLQDIRDGGVMVASEAGRVIAALHMTRSRRMAELRHVAVEESCRGRGIAGAMVAAFDQLCDCEKCQLWVAQDNAPALRLYEKLGFTPDGWTSTVWMMERNE